MSSLKLCKVCAVEKKTNLDSSLSDFRKTSGKKPDGTPYFRRICKPCENKRLAENRASLDKFAKSSNDKEVIKAKQPLREVKLKWNLIQKELRKAERDLGGIKRGLDSQKEFQLITGEIPPPPASSEGTEDITEDEIDFLVERELVPSGAKREIDARHKKQLEGGKSEYETFRSGLARGMTSEQIAEFEPED